MAKSTRIIQLASCQKLMTVAKTTESRQNWPCCDHGKYQPRCLFVSSSHALWTKPRRRKSNIAYRSDAAFFVQIPYGIIADKYGRRPVLFLALFGAVIQTAWILLVCKQNKQKLVYMIGLHHG